MKDYYMEATFLMREDIGDEGLKMAVALVKGAGFEVLKSADDGVKKLAYPMKEHEKAHYIFIEARGEQEQASLLGEMLDALRKNDDTILHYMLVKMLDRVVELKYKKGVKHETTRV